MRLIVTSGFAQRPNAAVCDALRAAAPAPRVAWVAPSTDDGARRFDDDRRALTALDVGAIEACDIDQQLDPVQLAYLHEFDVVFLADGDPVTFRRNMWRSGLGGRLRQSAAAGRLIVGDGGGAMLLTPNVSLARLHDAPVELVLAERERYDGTGAVPYEVLPHADGLTNEWLDKVRLYGEQVDLDIVHLGDGGAVLHIDGRITLAGPVVCYRDGRPRDEGAPAAR